MTEEQAEALRAQLEEATNSIKALETKNRELIVKNKRIVEQQKEINVEEHFKLVEDYDTLKSEHEKLLKVSKNESEKLLKSLQDKDSAIQRHLIEDGLSTHLAKVGVRPEFIEASKALLRQKTSLKEENGAYQALLGDKPLTDGIAEWVSGEGKHFIQASGGSGGGASGSNGGNNDLRKYFDKTSPDFSLTKQAEVYQSNPQLFEQLKG